MKKGHTCEVALASCIDFRFQETIGKWIDENLKSKREKYDRIGIAGAAKDLKVLLNQVYISVKLHNIKRLYLFNHEDCGAYGPEGNFERHKQDLIKARQSLQEKYPQLIVYLYYLHLDGSVDVVE